MEEKMIKVSIIIPVYNVEKYLRDCLDSIIHQTLQDIEIICINDGSTDGSLDVLREYEKKDSRIKIITQENKGLSATRNVGIPLAHGEYIHFMDSDDMMELDAFEKIYHYAKQHALDVVYFDGRSIFESEELLQEHKSYDEYYIRKHEYPDVLPGCDLFTKMKLQGDYRVQTCLQLFRREFINEKCLRFYEKIFYEDNIFTFECILQAERTAYVNKVFFIRRIRANSIVTQAKTFKHFYGSFICYLTMNSFALENKYLYRNEELSTAIRTEVNGQILSARRQFALVNDEEKQRIDSMDPLEKYFFQIYVADNFAKNNLSDEVKKFRQQVEESNAAIRESDKKIALANKEIASANEKVKSLHTEINKLNNNVTKLQKKVEKSQLAIAKLKNGKAYRLGKAVLWFPKKVKNLAVLCKNTLFKKLTKTEKNIWLIGIPDHGNLGDNQIAESELEFLHDIFPTSHINEITMALYWERKASLVKEIKKQDILFFNGGGNLGTLWPRSELIRRDAFAVWKENNKIILPQSVLFSEDEDGKKELVLSQKTYQAKTDILICREKPSYDFSKQNFTCRVILSPDIVLYSNKSRYAQINREGALLCFRTDKEKSMPDSEIVEVQTLLEKQFGKIDNINIVISGFKIDDKQRALDAFFEEIGSAKVVVTDRLHGMIFCAITETPCVVFPNNYHKLVASYEWLKDLPYIKLIKDTQDFESALQEVLAVKDRRYQQQQMRQHFREVTEVLNKM